MNNNLQDFYAVQLCSGWDSHIFCTEEEAEAAIASRDQELDNQLERWLNGDRSVSDSLIQSELESDCDGGCYVTYHINPAWRPVGFVKLPAYTQEFDVWADCPGANKISWGNPALQKVSESRPRSASSIARPNKR